MGFKNASYQSEANEDPEQEKSRQPTCSACPSAYFRGRPGGPEPRAPRLEDLGPDREGRGGGGDSGGGWAGGEGAPATMCTFVMRLLCCGRRGARLAPINVVLDEEAEELVELLEGGSFVVVDVVGLIVLLFPGHHTFGPCALFHGKVGTGGFVLGRALGDATLACSAIRGYPARRYQPRPTCVYRAPLSLISHPVSKAQLAKLQAIFANIDVSKTGTVYCSEVLSVVGMAQSPFTDNLFRLVGELVPSATRTCPLHKPCQA